MGKPPYLRTNPSGPTLALRVSEGRRAVKLGWARSQDTATVKLKTSMQKTTGSQMVRSRLLGVMVFKVHPSTK